MTKNQLAEREPMCSKLDENKVTTDKLNKAGDEEKKKKNYRRTEGIQNAKKVSKNIKKKLVEVPQALEEVKGRKRKHKRKLQM